MKLRNMAATLLAATVWTGAATAQNLPDGATVEAVETAEDNVRIAFLSFQNNPFWIPVTEGAMAAKDYLADFNGTLDYVDLRPSAGPAQWLRRLRPQAG